MKRHTIKILLSVLFVTCLVGCTKKQSDKAAAVETNVKNGVQIAENALEQFNAVIQAAAPNSKLAKQTAQATVTAQKVNGVVQTVTITVPVTDTTPVPAPVAPAQ